MFWDISLAAFIYDPMWSTDLSLILCMHLYILFFPLIITYGSDPLLVKSFILPKMIFIGCTLFHCMSITWVYFRNQSSFVICLLFVPSNIAAPFFLSVYFIASFCKIEWTGSVRHHAFGGTAIGHYLKPGVFKQLSLFMFSFSHLEDVSK